MNSDVKRIIGKYLLLDITIVKEQKRLILIELLNKTYWIEYNLLYKPKSTKYKHITIYIKNQYHYDFWIC